MNHASDCAVHNEPAMPAGPCDCHTGRVVRISMETGEDEVSRVVKLTGDRARDREALASMALDFYAAIQGPDYIDPREASQ